MKLPVQTEPAMWGVVAGAAFAIIIGFSVADWHTAGKVITMGNTRAALATSAALAPVCVEMFKRDANYDANLVALKKADQWARYTYIEKGGWGQMPGTEKLSSDTAGQCAALLVKA